MVRAVPVFEYWPTRGFNNRPESFTFRYLDTPYSQSLIMERTKVRKLVQVMKQAVLSSCGRILFPHGRINTLQVLRTINVTIIGRNVGEGQVASNDRFYPVSTLTVDRLNSIFNRILISGTPSSMADIEWVMVIDQNSLDLGGAEKSKLAWYKKKEKVTRLSCDTYADVDGKINCGAWAINALMNRRVYKAKTSIKRYNFDARNLQNELGNFK